MTIFDGLTGALPTDTFLLVAVALAFSVVFGLEVEAEAETSREVFGLASGAFDFFGEDIIGAVGALNDFRADARTSSATFCEKEFGGGGMFSMGESRSKGSSISIVSWTASLLSLLS